MEQWFRNQIWNSKNNWRKLRVQLLLSKRKEWFVFKTTLLKKKNYYCAQWKNPHTEKHIVNLIMNEFLKEEKIAKKHFLPYLWKKCSFKLYCGRITQGLLFKWLIFWVNIALVKFVAYFTRTYFDKIK